MIRPYPAVAAHQAVAVVVASRRPENAAGSRVNHAVAGKALLQQPVEGTLGLGHRILTLMFG
jgi:hypothetical protein